MKRITSLSPWLAFALGLALMLAAGFQRTNSGDPIQTVVESAPACPWISLGSITASQATLAVGARDYSTVWTDLSDAKTIKWDALNEAKKVEFRFSGQTNNHSNTIEVWVATGAVMADGTTEEHFTLGAILTTTVGQQTGSHSNLFVDTISVAEYALFGTTVLDSAADRMCIWKANLRGYKKVLFIATTLNSDAVWADGRLSP